MNNLQNRRGLNSSSADAYADVTQGGMLIGLVMFLLMAIIAMVSFVKMSSMEATIATLTEQISGTTDEGKGPAKYDLYQLDGKVYVIDLEPKHYEETGRTSYKIHYQCRETVTEDETKWLYPGWGGGGGSLGGVR